MAYYRISYDGYVEGDYENEEDAINDFIDIIENGNFYGRDLGNQLTIEKYDEENEKWE